MWPALRKLADRLFSRHAYEPADQNGFDCLLLAALDQLDDLGEQLPGIDATLLRGSARAWMRENATLVVGDFRAARQLKTQILAGSATTAANTSTSCTKRRR